MVVMFFRRREQNLKTGISHIVRYITNDVDTPPPVDPHHFDNPVYGFQPTPVHSTATDSSTLLNIRHHPGRPSDLNRSKC